MEKANQQTANAEAIASSAASAAASAAVQAALQYHREQLERLRQEALSKGSYWFYLILREHIFA